MTTHLLDRLARGADYSKLPAPGDCIFCDIIAGRQGAHIIASTRDYIAFLDALPIRTGHTLVVPTDHCPRIAQLSERQAAGVMQGVIDVTRAMEAGTSRN